LGHRPHLRQDTVSLSLEADVADGEEADSESSENILLAFVHLQNPQQYVHCFAEFAPTSMSLPQST
jgi:hypothetical protein